MDLRLLRYFAACVDAKSLHAAAEVLHVSQPALSKAIHTLEAELGVPVLERRPRGVVPTAYGETLLRYAKLIDSELRHATAEIDAMRGATKGEISLGVVPTMIKTVAEAAASVLRTHPGLKLKVKAGFSAELTTALLDGEIDVAVLLLQDGGAPLGLAFEPLLQTDPAIVARTDHPLAGGPAPRLSDLLAYPWMIPVYPASHRKVVSQVFLDAGLKPPAATMEVSTVVAFATLIRDTDMLTIMPRTLLASGSADGIAPLPVSFPFAPESVGLAYRENSRLLPGARIVMEAVRTVSAAQQ